MTRPAWVVPFLLAATPACWPDDSALPVIAVVMPGRDVEALTELAMAEFVSHDDPDMVIHYEPGTEPATPELDIAAAERVTRIGRLVGVVGHGGSSSTIAAWPVYQEAGVVVLTPTGTSRALDDLDGRLLTLAPDEMQEGAFLARYLRVSGARRITILYTNNDYGNGLRGALVAALAGAGPEVLDQVVVAQGADPAVQIEASLHRRGVPDVAVVASLPRITGLAARAYARLGTATRVLGGDGSLVPAEVRIGAGDAVGRVAVVAFWSPHGTDSLTRAFVARFQSATGHLPHSTDAVTYDAIRLLVHGFRAAGPRATAIARHLRGIGTGQPPIRGLIGPLAPGARRTRQMHIVPFGPDGAVGPPVFSMADSTL